MLSLERALALGASVALGILVARPALADDAPVERPSVAHPAMPQSTPEQSSPVERPATTHPAPAQSAARARGARREPRSAATPTRRDRHSAWLYLGAGLGVLTGLSGGADFERTNPALTGIVGVELPLGGATGLGFELAADGELAGSADRGSYAGALLRVRLSQLLTPSTRLWGALGIGGAGYQNATLAGGLAAGSTFLFTPKFGLDLSANLNLLGASHDSAVRNAGLASDYQGGFVLLIALKAMFEIGKSR